MKKDKEWLRDELMKLKESTWGRYEDVIGVSHVLRSIDQLEEPEKVVIPQFVADAFDYDKNPYWEVDESKDVSHVLKCVFDNEAKPSDFLDWVRENPEDYVMAVRNGFEVEKEKLYRIELPSGHIVYNNGAKEKPYYSYIPKGLAEGTPNSTFTEKEIKDYDERFWLFAMEVTE